MQNLRAKTATQKEKEKTKNNFNLKGDFIMTNYKMTKRELYNILLGLNDVIAIPDVYERIEQEIEVLNKKNNADTKKDIENNELMVVIKEFIGDGEYTATEIYKALNDRFTSVQKVTALLTKLYNNGELERFKNKDKIVFKLVEAE